MAQLFELFDRHGDDLYGEDVTQRRHALQTAHHARLAGEDDALIVAALFHDIGQMLGGAGSIAERQGRDAGHERIGALFLKGVFPETVLAPIRLHVAAKRYLCSVGVDYRDTLSEASLLSLRLQGGAFSQAEAKVFAALPFAKEAVRLRRYDDGGKDSATEVSALESYHALVETMML